MNQKALKTLEYTKVITQLESHAASPLGKSLCRDLVPSSDLEEVRTWQAQTTDAADRVRLKGTVSFSGLRDIGSSLKTPGDRQLLKYQRTAFHQFRPYRRCPC